MRNKKVLAILAGIGLALFFASWVLAQAPIEGWDKARFRMSPKGVKYVYREVTFLYGEEYFKEFWQESEEILEVKGYISESGEISFSEPLVAPYTLSTSRLRILGVKSHVYFSFVNDKLFRIEISGEIEGPMDFEMDEAQINSAIEKGKKLILGLNALRDHLTEKYGEPFREGRTWVWEDVRGNTILLKIDFREEYIPRRGKSFYFPVFKIICENKELREVWNLRKKEELRKMQEREEKRLREEIIKMFGENLEALEVEAPLPLPSPTPSLSRRYIREAKVGVSPPFIRASLPLPRKRPVQREAVHPEVKVSILPKKSHFAGFIPLERRIEVAKIKRREEIYPSPLPTPFLSRRYVKEPEISLIIIKTYKTYMLHRGEKGIVHPEVDEKTITEYPTKISFPKREQKEEERKGENIVYREEKVLLLGIIIREIDENNRRRFGFSEGGLVIAEVQPGGPADQVGILKRDLILEINNECISDISGFRKVMQTIQPGDSVLLKVKRGELGLAFVVKTGK